MMYFVLLIPFLSRRALFSLASNEAAELHRIMKVAEAEGHSLPDPKGKNIHSKALSIGGWPFSSR